MYVSSGYATSLIHDMLYDCGVCDINLYNNEDWIYLVCEIFFKFVWINKENAL